MHDMIMRHMFKCGRWHVTLEFWPDSLPALAPMKMCDQLAANFISEHMDNDYSQGDLARVIMSKRDTGIKAVFVMNPVTHFIMGIEHR